MKYRALICTGEVLRFEAKSIEHNGENLYALDDKTETIIVIPHRQLVYVAREDVTPDTERQAVNKVH